MPKLVRLYIHSIAVGFGLSGLLTAGLLGMDIAGLGHLVLQSDMGPVAVAMLFACFGILFSAVQFGLRIMTLATADDRPRGGLRQQAALVPVPVRVRMTQRATNRSKSHLR